MGPGWSQPLGPHPFLLRCLLAGSLLWCLCPTPTAPTFWLQIPDPHCQPHSGPPDGDQHLCCSTWGWGSEGRQGEGGQNAGQEGAVPKVT